LLQAIARAGGRGELADFSNIMVFRRSDGVTVVGRKYDGTEIQSGVIDDPILQANDVIVVKRSPGRVVLRDSIISDVIGIFNPFSYLGR
jgi:polysaccharide export outer membrane protein